MAARALAFGEILWDIIDGVPYIGGATFNLLAHMSKMGADAYMISALGDDDLGKRALTEVKQLNINTPYIKRYSGFPTGTVDVFIDSQGQPDFSIHEETAWDHIELDEESRSAILNDTWDAFCFGTISQRTESNRSLLHLLLSQIHSRHFFYDVNLRQSYYDRSWIEPLLEHSTILKLNDQEVIVLSRMFYQEDLGMEEFAVRLSADFSLEVVLITRGGEGALIYDGKSFSSTGCEDVPIADTVGAGDSFSAGFLTAYLAGYDALQAAQFAGRVADFVVTQTGAVPEYPEELESDLRLLYKNS